MASNDPNISSRIFWDSVEDEREMKRIQEESERRNTSATTRSRKPKSQLKEEIDYAKIVQEAELFKINPNIGPEAPPARKKPVGKAEFTPNFSERAKSAKEAGATRPALFQLPDVEDMNKTTHYQLTNHMVVQKILEYSLPVAGESESDKNTRLEKLTTMREYLENYTVQDLMAAQAEQRALASEQAIYDNLIREMEFESSDCQVNMVPPPLLGSKPVSSKMMKNAREVVGNEKFEIEGDHPRSHLHHILIRLSKLFEEEQPNEAAAYILLYDVLGPRARVILEGQKDSPFVDLWNFVQNLAGSPVDEQYWQEKILELTRTQPRRCVDTLTSILRMYIGMTDHLTPRERSQRLRQNCLTDLKSVVKKFYPHMYDAVRTQYRKYENAWTQEARVRKAKGLPISGCTTKFHPINTYITVANDKISPIESPTKVHMAHDGFRLPVINKGRNRDLKNQSIFSTTFEASQDDIYGGAPFHYNDGTTVGSTSAYDVAHTEEVAALSAQPTALTSVHGSGHPPTHHAAVVSAALPPGELIYDSDGVARSEVEVAAMYYGQAPSNGSMPLPGQGPNSNMPCFNCGRTGHLFKKCPRYPGHPLKPRDAPPCTSCGGRHSVECRKGWTMDQIEEAEQKLQEAERRRQSNAPPTHQPNYRPGPDPRKPYGGHGGQPTNPAAPVGGQYSQLCSNTVEAKKTQ